MKYIIIIVFTFNILTCFGQNMKPENPINVLVVTDARKFNREAFFEMFDSFENIKWHEMSHPKILDFFGSDSIKTYDAVIFYDMPENVSLTDWQKQNMLNFFNENAPAIFLHHSLLSYRQWDTFTDIIGGRYYNKTPLIKENGDTLQSVYQHDVKYSIRIANDEHPITLGMHDFEITDETYKNYFVKKDVEILLTTDHPLSGPTIGWINTYGNSKIVYLINGHNETAYENQNFRELLYNSIKWVAKNKNE